MPYYFTKTLDRDFDEVIEKVSQALERQGFSILTEIDVSETFRRELGVEFEKYRIFGACNVSHAYRALKVDKKNCIMLPCNVIVYEIKNGRIEVAVVNPMASIRASDSLALCEIAYQVSAKLEFIIEKL
ncbi:hypothetical protein LCGC14_1194070 [marine sediment metagenome]|uniref:DUF302 domain-containing protein n=2 Tax=root TaxID=1 RepID=A0A831QW50_9FLAO|nr:DUF302 domain-containing protein [Pricia antarctica]